MAGLLRSRKGVFLIGGIIAVAVIIAVVVVVVVSKTNSDEEAPSSTMTVAVEEGLLRGSWVDAAQGGGFKFAAFRGVPYAAPPIGELRFKGPRPPKKWSGVRDAFHEGSMCYQLGDQGSEDCLYLNVYTPVDPAKVDNKPMLPVYFYIHGGAFIFGSATEALFGPDFLLQHDIIVVTMNYRLGAFGFFSLDNEDIPGNAGLKDQLAALRWVHKNIHVFGGDPDRITLGGQSAGGASAGWLAILPESNALIKAAALQSGCGLQSWNFNRRPMDIVEETVLNLAGKNVRDKSVIARLLMNATASELLKASSDASNSLKERKILGNGITILFSPTLELRDQGSESILIRANAESYIIKSESNDIPLMLGMTSQEWAFFFESKEIAHNEEKLEEEIQNLRFDIPVSILPDQQTREILGIQSSDDESAISDAEQKLRGYFFNETSSVGNCTNACKMAKFQDQGVIMADMSHYARVRAKYSNKPTYMYVFNLQSDYNENKTDRTPDFLMHAVAHGDDINHIWRREDFKQDYYGTSVSSECVRRMVAIMANFVKFGNPTPEHNFWRPIENGDEETYLEINENLIQRNESVLGPDVTVWTSIFSSNRENKSP